MRTSASPVPMSAPAGVTLRPFAGDDDLRAFSEIFAAGNDADNIDERISFATLANWVAHPGEHFDAARDLVVAEVEDRPVAYGWSMWVDTTDGARDYVTRGHVHTAWRRRGTRSGVWCTATARTSTTSRACASTRRNFIRSGSRAILRPPAA